MLAVQEEAVDLAGDEGAAAVDLEDEEVCIPSVRAIAIKK